MYKEMFYTEDLNNVSEEVVFEELSRIITAGEKTFCQCNVCIQDIAAIALNAIPPKYESNYIEKQYPRRERLDGLRRLREQVQGALHEAIRMIQQNPHH
jgi:competence protein ComFB